jgi:hypothetical protein
MMRLLAVVLACALSGCTADPLWRWNGDPAPLPKPAPLTAAEIHHNALQADLDATCAKIRAAKNADNIDALFKRMVDDEHRLNAGE